MTPLTGQPHIGGYLRRYAAAQGPVLCEFDRSGSRYRTYASGTVELVRTELRLRGKATWAFKYEQEALSLVSDIQEPFPVVPRTRATGDPDWAEEVEVLCRATNPLPSTAPLSPTVSDTGRPLWVVEVEFEGLATYAALPGVPLGGFEEVARSTDGYGIVHMTVGPYGEATMEEGDPYTITLGDGSTVEIDTADLGTPAIVWMRGREVDGGLLLQIREPS